MSKRTCSVDGCEKPYLARGMCSMHYRRWWFSVGGSLPDLNRPCQAEGCSTSHRSPSGLCRLHRDRMRKTGSTRGRATLPERFWSHVNVSGDGDCWEWTAAIHPKTGYGLFTWPSTSTRSGWTSCTAHRAALALHQGIDPPAGLDCAHSCDNRPCCNPAHLRWATRAENQHDKVLRGRAAAGAKCGSAVSAEVAAGVRTRAAAGEELMTLVREYGINRNTVTHLVDGKHHRDTFDPAQYEAYLRNNKWRQSRRATL